MTGFLIAAVAVGGAFSVGVIAWDFWLRNKPETEARGGARNTGRGTRAGRPDGRFLWAKVHGGLFGRINRRCRRLGDQCPCMIRETEARGG